MKPKAQRTRMKMMGDVLEKASEAGTAGLNITTLLRRANLSTVSANGILRELVGSGMMADIRVEGRRTVVITPKGRTYLEDWRRFHDMAESFGLEL